MRRLVNWNLHNAVYNIAQYMETQPGNVAFSVVLLQCKLDNGTETQIEALKKRLVTNKKVHFDPVTEICCFIPSFDVRNADELLSLLTRMQDTCSGGVALESLQDSYQNVTDDVHHLQNQEMLYTINTVDKKKKDVTVFLKNAHLDFHIPSIPRQKLAAKWNDVRVEQLSHLDITKRLVQEKIPLMRTRRTLQPKAQKRKRKVKESTVEHGIAALKHTRR